jgi:hypothetical protein
MSYYDEPHTLLNAQIASQKSILTDQLYTYRKVITTIATTPVDSIDLNVFTQAQSIIGDIQYQKLVIQQLELQLNMSLVEPVVDLSSNPIDLSSNPVDLSTV